MLGQISHRMRIGAEQLAKGLVALLTLLSGGVLMIIMLSVFVDVVGRYFFNLPIKGINELVSLLLAFSVFFCIPVVTYRFDHIKVALLDDYLPEWIKNSVSLLSYMIMIVGLWGIADKIAIWLQRFLSRNQSTLFLEIPMAWFAYLAIFSCYATILLLLLRACQVKQIQPKTIEAAR